MALDEQVPLARAAHWLAAGDPIRALGALGTTEGSHALALRGIALAQIGQLDSAERALRAASALFERDGDRSGLARAAAARAEIALARRDLAKAARLLAPAIATLERLGDRLNARFLTIVAARHAILVGDVARARDAVSRAAKRRKGDDPPMLDALAAIAEGEIALRSQRASEAKEAVARARAGAVGNPAIAGEAHALQRALDLPIGRLGDDALTLAELEELRERDDVAIIDSCRRTLTIGSRSLDLAKRPVLFALLEVLADGPLARDVIIERAFAAKKANASHRVRLRVEVGRLRRLLGKLGKLEPTAMGYELTLAADEIAVVRPSTDDASSAVAALLADGRAWAAREIAIALGLPPRTVQRALETLAADGAVDPQGKGPATRWVRRAPAIAPSMLLLGLYAPR